MIKLTVHRSSPDRVVIRLDGRLDVETAAEVPRLAGAESGRVTLDLAGLVALDAAGGACLAELRASGCELVGGSLYVNRLLEEMEP